MSPSTVSFISFQVTTILPTILTGIPISPTGLDDVVQQDDELVPAVEALTTFAYNMIDEIAKYF
jgi:hypothetical protein